jgi:limonene 1,2-monooxygenase
MAGEKLRFGAFIAPFHPLDENPTQAIERDLELVQHMDRLGFDEAWIGEHHSAGYELISSPELFIATAAERTRNIRVGTGALPSDAFMMGIPVSRQRDRMDESLAVLIPLLRGEVVTKKTDWFELNEARLQMMPFSRPSVEFSVASQVSPSGATAAGRHGLGLLSIGATSAGGFNALASNWAIAETNAATHGNTMNREQWRLVGPMHIAATREEARAQVRYGLEKWLYYFREVAALPLAPDDGSDPVDSLVNSGMAVIGTPDDAIAQIERLQRESGGFGAFLLMDANWAEWDHKKKSYEMIARHVAPRFQQLNVNRDASLEWAAGNHERFIGEARAAVGARIAQHIQNEGTRNISPEILQAMAAAKAGAAE